MKAQVPQPQAPVTDKLFDQLQVQAARENVEAKSNLVRADQASLMARYGFRLAMQGGSTSPLSSMGGYPGVIRSGGPAGNF